MDEKLKSENMQKKSSFLNILRARQEGIGPLTKILRTPLHCCALQEGRLTSGFLFAAAINISYVAVSAFLVTVSTHSSLFFSW